MHQYFVAKYLGYGQFRPKTFCLPSALNISSSENNILFAFEKFASQRKIFEKFCYLTMSTMRKVRVPVDLSNLSETEAKKVEMVLRRAERIQGNGAIFERLNSGTLVCRNTKVRDPKELISK